MSKISQFVGELKRRRVYGAAVAYIVVGLGVLGAADVILDPLGPGNARPLIVVLPYANMSPHEEGEYFSDGVTGFDALRGHPRFLNVRRRSFAG